MTPEQYKAFSDTVRQAPKPDPTAAQAAAKKLPETTPMLHAPVILPSKGSTPAVTVPVPAAPVPKPVPEPLPLEPTPKPTPEPVPEPEQQELPMPQPPQWRMVGELYRTYILVEQGDNAFLIDKHAAHERILFDKLKANQETILGQSLLSPIALRLEPREVSVLMANLTMMEALGFELEEFGENTLLLRQIPMDLNPDAAKEAVEELADNLLRGKITAPDTVRDEMLHTVACKAAIKAGWVNDDRELLEIVKAVKSREDLKYCPHGRPICVTLSKKQLEKQFKRT